MTATHARPTDPATWAESPADPADVTAYTGAKQAAGFSFREALTYNGLNWFWRQLGRWIRHLDERAPRVFDTLEEAAAATVNGQHFEIRESVGAIGEVAASVTLGAGFVPSCVHTDGQYVYLGHGTSGGNYITCYSRDLSTVVWSATLGGLTYAVDEVVGIAVVNDDYIAVIGSYDTSVHGVFIALVQRSDGQVWANWDTANCSAVAITTDGQKLYGVASAVTFSYLVVVDVATEAVDATTTITSSGNLVTDVATDGRYVYVVGESTLGGAYERDGTQSILTVATPAVSFDFTAIVAGSYGLVFANTNTGGTGGWSATTYATAMSLGQMDTGSPTLHMIWTAEDAVMSVSGDEPYALAYDGRAIWAPKLTSGVAAGSSMIADIDPATGHIRQALYQDDTDFIAITGIDADGSRLFVCGYDGTNGLLAVLHTGRPAPVRYERKATVGRYDDVRKLAVGR